jgi:hypothetical protein
MRVHSFTPGRLLRPALAAALSTATLAALGCSDSTGTGVGSFTAEVVGATDLSYSGESIGLRDGGYGYALVMESDADIGPNQFSMFLYRSDASTPAVGDHDVVEDPEADQFEGTIVLAEGEPTKLLCNVSSGTLTFTRSSGSSAAGSFDFDIFCILDNDPEAEPILATVTGTFAAVMATPI